jgi:hypothetical protein
MRVQYTGIFLLTISLLCGNTQADSVKYLVDIQGVTQATGEDYFTNLLYLILNASKAPNEEIELRMSDRHLSQARWISEIQKSEGNNLMWTATNNEREQLMRPIRVPIFKGMIGKRVLIIRAQDQDKFAKIKTKQDLAQLVAGQGAHWPDTDILETNHLPVMRGNSTAILYKMLAAKRFDYFPRSVIELESESSYLPANGLVLEKTLLLSYPEVMYFFVNKNNVELAGRLEKGWSIIIKNGQFDNFFLNHPRIKAGIEELRINKRKVIALNNPFLPEKTPIDQPEYWFASDTNEASSADTITINTSRRNK